MERQSPEQVAKTLIRHYKSPFGGKENGRYRFRQLALLGISGRRLLRDVFLQEIGEELFNRGYVLINLRGTTGPDFALISHRAIKNYRPLPKRLWEDPDEDEQLDEEEDDGAED